MAKLIVEYSRVREALAAYLANLPDDRWPVQAPVMALARNHFGWKPDRPGADPGDAFAGQVKRAINALVNDTPSGLRKDKGYAGVPRYYDQAAWERKLAAKAATAAAREEEARRWAAVLERLNALNIPANCATTYHPHRDTGRPEPGCPLVLPLASVERLINAAEWHDARYQVNTDTAAPGQGHLDPSPDPGSPWMRLRASVQDDLGKLAEALNAAQAEGGQALAAATAPSPYAMADALNAVLAKMDALEPGGASAAS